MAVFGLWAGGFAGTVAGQVAPPGNPPSHQSTNPPSRSATARNSAIYARATNGFGSAVFFRPKETTAEDLVFRLAPLMMCETQPPKSEIRNPKSTVPSATQSVASEFGALEWSNGIVKVDTARPAVYFDMDTVRINERAHARMTMYLWCYAMNPSGHEELGIQGIRLTLDLAGQPVIWEVLADSSGAELIFVSQSLEAAAARAFGKPLPGRRYAVERGSSEAPETRWLRASLMTGRCRWGRSSI